MNFKNFLLVEPLPEPSTDVSNVKNIDWPFLQAAYS